MTTEPTYADHIKRLNSKIDEISGRMWTQLVGMMLEPDDNGNVRILDIPDMNLIVTGVCVNLFAQHNALAVTSGFSPAIHGKEKMLENFNNWYPETFDKLLEQYKQGDTNEAKSNASADGVSSAGPSPG
jgi:hypothetical protein